MNSITPPPALLLASLMIFAGCSSGRSDRDEAKSPAAAGAAAEVASEAPPAVAPDDSQPLATTPAAEETVTLGDPSLTAGIPGEGPLELADIQSWLEDPLNHAVLKIRLPMGLDLGESNIVIPQDNPLTRAKIELGRQLYFDGRLSSDGSVSCADCHHPADGFARHTQFGVGVGGQMGNRNSPVTYNRILSADQFWDGRAASLEEQATGPIANPIEMGNTHADAVATVTGIEGYKIQFDKIFPDGVNIENIAKAIASFERAVVTLPSPYDYYEPLRALEQGLAGLQEDIEGLKVDDPELYASYMAAREASEAHPISEGAKRGRDLFFGDKARCTACHVGANFSDEKYHNLGVGMDKDEPDLGRYVVSKDDQDRGAFKTPTIRNVALSAPYMHDGSQQTLEEVVEWYSKGGHPNTHLDEAIKKLDLSQQEKADLVEFMKSCTGEFPVVEMGRLP